MIINNNREKFLNAIIYFAENTRSCGLTKIQKLMFLLDFEHYKQTGRSVTGENYEAWKMGPVSPNLHNSLKSITIPSDMMSAFVIEKSIQFEKETIVIKPIQQFNEDVFTPRELSILKDLSKTHYDTSAINMVNLLHADNSVWKTVWNNGLGDKAPIPYNLAIRDQNELNKLSELIFDREEFINQFNTIKSNAANPSSKEEI